MPMKIVNQDDYDNCYQTQTIFINIRPLFQYSRMPPPLRGGPINHEQPDYNGLSGSHKFISANLRKPSASPQVQGHQNHCNNLFSFYGEGHQGQATYKPSCYQPLTRLNAATNLYTAYTSQEQSVTVSNVIINATLMSSDCL